MRQGAKGVSWGSALALILVLSTSVANAQEPGKGNLVGFIYGEDGSTPVAGAVIVVRNLTTGLFTEAAASDALGSFRITGLGPGLYALGVKSASRTFNSQDFFGITAQQTSKLAIALNPYDNVAASGAAAVIKGQKEKGEAYVGRVVRYHPDSKEAEILVEIGLIQTEDRVHVKGQVTDFYQDNRTLKAYGAKTKRVTSGYTALLKTAKPCQEGDFVYVVCKRGVPPFFLAPLGIAAIVAGAVPLSATFEEEHASPYKIRN
jgi:hypothetical protein